MVWFLVRRLCFGIDVKLIGFNLRIITFHFKGLKVSEEFVCFGGKWFFDPSVIKSYVINYYKSPFSKFDSNRNVDFAILNDFIPCLATKKEE